MFLEQKQLRVLVVYICCVRLSTGNLYTTTAPENRPKPILIGNRRPLQIYAQTGAVDLGPCPGAQSPGPTLNMRLDDRDVWACDKVGVGSQSDDDLEV